MLLPTWVVSNSLSLTSPNWSNFSRVFTSLLSLHRCFTCFTGVFRMTSHSQIGAWSTHSKYFFLSGELSTSRYYFLAGALWLATNILRLCDVFFRYIPWHDGNGLCIVYYILSWILTIVREVNFLGYPLTFRLKFVCRRRSHLTRPQRWPQWPQRSTSFSQILYK